MSEKKVGLQLFSLRQFLRTEPEMRETLKKVRAMGYENVQVSGFGRVEPESLKAILEENELFPCSYHDMFHPIVENTGELIKLCKIMGYTNVACAVPPDDMMNEAGYRNVGQKLSKAGELLFKNGITLVYHNHGFELMKYRGKSGLEIIYEESDPRYLQTELDTYWLAFGGADPIEWINKYKDRCPIIHLKDMSVFYNQIRMSEIGNGNLNWQGIFKALKGTNCRWYVVEQDFCGGNPFDSVKMSFDNLKKMGIE